MACLFVLLCFILGVSAVMWFVWEILPTRARRWILYQVDGQDGKTPDPEIERAVHKRKGCSFWD